jgi:hypothetical protein
MNNIEKFQQIKELTRLKSEYHKTALLDLLSFTTKTEVQKTESDIADVAFTGITLYQQIMDVIKQRENA